MHQTASWSSSIKTKYRYNNQNRYRYRPMEKDREARQTQSPIISQEHTMEKEFLQLIILGNLGIYM